VYTYKADFLTSIIEEKATRIFLFTIDILLLYNRVMNAVGGEKKREQLGDK
jgi:hypothetical protein